MAKKKTINTTKNILLITIFGVVTLILFVNIIRNQTPNTNNLETIPSLSVKISPTPQFINYKSDKLKISFTAPSDYKITESGNDISLINNVGKIYILRNGTNSDTIEGYVFGISDRGKMEITNKQKLIINDIDVISCRIKSLVSDDPVSRNYYFYAAPWTVFVISANVPELFDDLDQIARSFRYMQ